MTETPFWQRKSLEQMTHDEWESLCDGCGKCCLHKLEDEDSGEICYTNVACRYLDDDSCRCQDYSNRKAQVPGCIVLTAADIASFGWLPKTCAYRLLAQGESLPNWHPLVSGRQQSVHEASISVRGKVLSETYVHPDGLDEHIVNWVDDDAIE